MTDYGFCCGTEPLKKIGCPVTNCHFSFERQDDMFLDNALMKYLSRDLLPDEEDWDVIWFGSRSLPKSPHENDMPQKRFTLLSLGNSILI